VRTAILVRHAESENGARGVVNGDPAAAIGLTEAGRRQAHRLADLLVLERIGLCVMSEFARAHETARLVLGGRDVPRLVVPELNDVRYGAFEGGPFEDYRAWAGTHGALDEPPGDGESRVAVTRRFVAGYRTVLGRPEPAVLVVAHGLPIRYVLDASSGAHPTPVVEQVPYAEPHHLTRAQLEAAVKLLEDWCAAPTW